MNAIKNNYTVLGLLISYFSISLLNILFSQIYGSQLNNFQAISREMLVFVCMAFLFWIIIKKENRTLESIGLYNSKWRKTVINVIIGLLITIGGIALSLWLLNLLGLEFGTSTAFDKLTPIAVLIIVIRAGVVEEVFMRGYIYERLKEYLKSPIAAALLSTIPFALFHYNQGWAGIIISFILGSILMGLYMWKRDLKANIIIHFLIDFIPNLLLVSIL